VHVRSAHNAPHCSGKCAACIAASPSRCNALRCSARGRLAAARAPQTGCNAVRTTSSTHKQPGPSGGRPFELHLGSWFSCSAIGRDALIYVSFGHSFGVLSGGRNCLFRSRASQQQLFAVAAIWGKKSHSSEILSAKRFPSGPTRPSSSAVGQLARAGLSSGKKSPPSAELGHFSASAAAAAEVAEARWPKFAAVRTLAPPVRGRSPF